MRQKKKGMLAGNPESMPFVLMFERCFVFLDQKYYLAFLLIPALISFFL